MRLLDSFAHIYAVWVFKEMYSSRSGQRLSTRFTETTLDRRTLTSACSDLFRLSLRDVGGVAINYVITFVSVSGLII